MTDCTPPPAAPAPAPPSVFVRNARLSFGGTPLFEDLDFALAGGRWTCLLGPSGVGKTTLLRLIAGLAPAGAEADIGCSDERPLSGRAAYMAQQDLLLPWLSLIDNALLGRRLRGEPCGAADRARAEALFARVGLEAAVNDAPSECSGGMRQRAALVRTLLEDRPVILMDEPFSALDAITRVRLQGLAAELLVGRTVLLVTHDPLEALRLGHRIFVMADRPVRLDAPIEPETAPPRLPTDPDLLRRQGELLSLLAAAGGTAGP